MSLEKDDINSMVEWWNGEIVQKKGEMVKFCYGIILLWHYGVTLYS